MKGGTAMDPGAGDHVTDEDRQRAAVLRWLVRRRIGAFPTDWRSGLTLLEVVALWLISEADRLDPLDPGDDHVADE